MDYKKEVIDSFRQLDELENTFGNYSKMYMFTNENINSYLNLFDLDNKNILTVCSSGDQALSLLTKNINKVTLFDINNLSKCIFELKRAIIINLDLDTYNSFFDIHNNNFLSLKIYNKINQSLSFDVKELLDYIFNNYDSEFIFKKMFYGYYKTPENMKRLLPYLDYNSYYELSKKLKDLDIDFINTDIYNLINYLNIKYDFMLFSNITDYIINNKQDLVKFKEYILELRKYLNNNGSIQIGYLYNYDSSKINFKKGIENISLNDSYGICIRNELDGYKELSKDLVLTYIKIK